MFGFAHRKEDRLRRSAGLRIHALRPAAPLRLARAIAHGVDLDFDDCSFEAQRELLAAARLVLAHLGGHG